MGRRISLTSWATVTFLVFLGAVLAAQQTATSKAAEPKYMEIKYSADASSYRWDGEDRVLVLKGNVKFVQGDTVLLADKVDYQESTRTAKATGNLKIYDDQSSITGETCAVNFKEKLGTLTGSIRMVAKPKPKGENPESQKTGPLKSELKDEATITCDKIDYFYKEKRAVIPGPVKIVQKARTVTANSATYLGNEEVVHLVGDVSGRDEKEKHTFSASKVTISLKESDEWIEAEKATGSFYIKEEETPSEGSASESE